MISRRSFVAYTGGAGFALYAHDSLGVSQMLLRLSAASLDPATIPKYQTPLLVPPVMPKAGRISLRNGKNADYYEVSIRQFAQQILPAGLPATTVWGYGPVTAERKGATMIHHAPSLTIEATRGTPVMVKWINELKDASGGFLPHLLPVDPTLHWANPPGGPGGTDVRPTFTTTPTAYTGPVPMVTHVHGAVGLEDDSDGYAEAWYLPNANNIPAGFATKGRWYDFFAGRAASRYGTSWGPGFATFAYPNTGRATTDWYHDHSLGMTRVNVYAGPAGFYMIRGGQGGDGDVRDSRDDSQAVLPTPAPKENDGYPVNKRYYEIPIAIQDRAFRPDGSLFYPDSRSYFDGNTGPYIPDTDLPPIWNPEFFGNTLIVNGNTWPFHTVEKRRYRLRFLNGCTSRFLILDFSQIAGISVWQIGNEGGFLAAPVNLTADHGNRLLMAPAERADLIVDFGGVAVGNHVLRNVGPDEPFGGGVPGLDFVPSDTATTGQIMQFRVVPVVAPDTTTPPAFLALPVLAPLPATSVTRRLALLEEMSMYAADAPVAGMLGTVDANPTNWAPWTMKMWRDAVTENPQPGGTEVWEIFNTTEDAHPMHLHAVKFEVMNRQAIDVDGTNRQVRLRPASVALAPEPWETGTKDTAVAYPGQVTRLRVRFGQAGQFVWHCHIVEHEDNEMMRPMRIGPTQSGQPG